jgi:NAD(P)H dehydrogenase (quinone)
MKKILVLLGHPDAGSFSGALVDAYISAAQASGHEIRRTNIGDMHFDPILHKGYKEIQQLEPDLTKLQEDIKWADHLVLVYPNWWNTMPAILKGLFDRMWLPGFAFNFDKATKKLIQRLKGKTARVIIIAGTQSPFQTWWKYGDFTNEIRRGILAFAGFSPVSLTAFGPAEHVADTKKEGWKKKVEVLGRKGI